MKTLMTNHLDKEMGLLLILNILLIAKVPLLGDIAAICYLFGLPGFIILNFFKEEIKDSWGRILHTVALSIFFLLIGGLLANTVGLIRGLEHPLTKNFLLVFFDALMIALIILRISIGKNEKRTGGEVSVKNILPHISLAVLPLLAIAGTTILNNGGSNTVTLVLVASVAVIIALLSLRAHKVSEELLQSAIYFIALSLLFMASMRAWHVIGYDINRELRVFMLTQNNHLWSMANFQDAYNACLSITLLPTVVAEFLHINNEYIYKFLFQFIFALMPVALYRLARRFADVRTAFLSAVFCMVQVWFFQDMPTLIRQEFGILFFTLVMATLFDTSLPKRTRYSLVGIYGAGMIVSHYSTTYIAIFLFLGVFILNQGIMYFKQNRGVRKKALRFSRAIVPSFVIFLVSSVLIWNTLATGTSGNITDFFGKSSSSMAQIFAPDDLLPSLGKLVYRSPEEIDLSAAMQKTISQYREDHAELEYYTEPNIQSETANEVNFASIPHYQGEAVFRAASTSFKVLKLVCNNIFIVFGIISMAYLWWKRKIPYSEIVFFAATGFALLVFLTIIPGALQEYNIERLYFQMLVVWSFVGVLGGAQILRLLAGRRYALDVLTGMYILLFLFYSGFIYNFIGGPAFVTMNNYGEEFEKFYAVEEDVQAAKWLGNNYHNELIYTNSSGFNKLAAFSNVPENRIVRSTLPEIISKDAFVFSTQINTQGGKGVFIYKVNDRLYVYPTDFLEKNKNLIYSNGVSRIYR